MYHVSRVEETSIYPWNFKTYKNLNSRVVNIEDEENEFMKTML